MNVAKLKPREVEARVVGAIPVSDNLAGELRWRVRMAVPRFPFYIDSQMSFSNKPEADRMAERWKRRRVVLSISED